VEVRAPIGATVVEKNVAVGDFVTTELDMFKIADLTRLDVLAHVYEEDLPELEKLPREQRKWTIYLRTDPDARPLEGSFEQIGSIIDPNQHTALTMGWVDNSTGRLRVGQFVTANINLPAGPHEVAVPSSAVIDEEGKSLVFVQPDAKQNRYVCRHVLVIRRRDDLAYVSSQPPSSHRDKLVKPLHAGERVVTVGGVELTAELESLQAAEQSAATASTGITPAPTASQE
jgi:cobalt-zinc-cadmium efflux system membrane fusion protein